MARAAVYMLRNKVTGGSYVGASYELHARLTGHRRHIRRGDHPLRGVRELFAGHGLDALEIRLLEVMTVPGFGHRRTPEAKFAVKLLRQRERHWIKTLKPSANRVTPGGEIDYERMPVGPPE